MLVKWICLSLLQIGKDLLIVLVTLLKHFKENFILTTKSALINGFVFLFFSPKFVAFLNTVKPIKKGGALISFLSLRGAYYREGAYLRGLGVGGGGGFIENLRYLG